MKRNVDQIPSYYAPLQSILGIHPCSKTIIAAPPRPHLPSNLTLHLCRLSSCTPTMNSHSRSTKQT